MSASRDEPGLTMVNTGMSGANLVAGKESINIGGVGNQRSVRMKLRGIKGFTAFLATPGKPTEIQVRFTPVPVEDMTPGRYGYAILPEGCEVAFLYLNLGSANDTLQAACASKTGNAIVSFESEQT